jgi:hypothetical protein
MLLHRHPGAGEILKITLVERLFRLTRDRLMQIRFQCSRYRINKSRYQAFLSELLAFPTARHDDQVDALGLIGQLLDKMIPAQRIMPLKKNDPGYYVLNENEADRYVRSGSVGVDWSPVEEGSGGIDHAINWKAI